MAILKNLKLNRSILGLFILSSFLFGQITYEKITLSKIQSKVLKQSKNYKTGTSTVALGDYIWFDYNQNGIQDLGEQGLYNIPIKLYNNADCTGQLIAETRSSDIGYYQFKNIAPSTDNYCIAVEYPAFWTRTIDNKGSDVYDSELTLGDSSRGKIENILLSSNQSLDAGLHHRDENCQRPKLKLGLLGIYDKTKTWSKRAMLDVKFNNLVASGFCHEYHNGGPVLGERYSVHLKDRLGFTNAQRDYLSRAFGFMSDKEVQSLIVNAFDTQEKHYWFNLLSATFVWYYSDWKQNFVTLEEFIDTGASFSELTVNEKQHLKEIAKVILNKIEGINGATQYSPMNVYYLWNEDNDTNQDIIVPETSLVPDRTACIQKTETFMKAKIGNYIWLDSNRNGQQDSGELGLSGITVKLFTSENKAVASTHTDASGHYQFDHLMYGDYYLTFSVPNGYTVSPKNQGDIASDSDVNINGKTDVFSLENVTRQRFDMGLYPTPITLGNRVWEDINKNGLQDISEKNRNIANVKVELFTENGQLLSSTVTNVKGEYEFKDLVAGQYRLQFEIPENYKVSPLNQGTNDSLDSDVNTLGKTELFTLVAGLDNRSLDMGLYPKTAKVGDRVWYDINKNGVQDVGENGIADVEVKLYRVGESTAVATTKTSATGIYIFDNVLPDEYYMIFTAPVGYSITKATQGKDSTKDSDANGEGRTANFLLKSGTQNSTIDMGIYQQMVSIGDRVWLDTNHNGLQDVGESGIRDINVTVMSATSDFKKSMLTDENGNYIFSHLSAGEYRLEFRDIPYGYLLTEQNINNNANDEKDSDVFLNGDKKNVTELTLLTPSENDLSWDMGIYKTVCLPGKSVLGNLVWNDFNKNGIQDIGEQGVANVKVILYNNDTDENLSSTITDKNGLYEFAHIDPAFNYYVQFIVPSGYKVSPQNQDEESIDSDVDLTGKSEVVTVVADTIYANLDMGIYQEGSIIGDRVWFDEKDGLSNGIQDEGEQGAFDVKVTLYDANNQEINSTRTNASGEYRFSNIPKGSYRIEFSELPNGYIFVRQNQGADEEQDSDVNLEGKSFVFSVNGSQNITHVDAGIKKSRKGISSSDLKRGITGKTVTIDVLKNDVSGSFNFDPTTVKITSTPEGGVLSDDGKRLLVPSEGVWSVNPNTGEITFTPNEGYIGDPTAIAYSVQDTEGNETGADVKIDYPPVAKDDLVNAEVAKEVVVYVLDNDTNTSSSLDKTTVRIINPSSNDDAVEILSVTGEGVWSSYPDGSIHFLPDNGFINNPTVIEYVVQEELGDVSNRASVTIIYPDAVDDTFIVPPEHRGEIIVNVSENDSNNTNPSEITIGCNQGVNTLTVQNEGIWQVNGDGSITFVAEHGFVGEPKNIQYTVGLLSGGRSNCATIDIRYALLAVDDRSVMNVGSVTLIDVLNNDFGNINASTLSLVVPKNAPQGTTLSENGHILTVPREGTWRILPSNMVSFTALEGFTGVPIPIGYQVENNDGIQSNVATITLLDGVVSGVSTIIANDDIGQAQGNANPIIINVLENDEGDLNGSQVFLIDDNGSLVERIVIEGEGVWRIEDNRVVFTPVTPFIGTPTQRNYLVRDRLGNNSNLAGISFIGQCVCSVYESNIPTMTNISGFLMFLLTLLIAKVYLRDSELIKNTIKQK